MPGSQGQYSNNPRHNPPENNPNPTGALSLGIYYDDSYINGKSRKNGGRSLNDLQKKVVAKKIKFCKPCFIKLYACRVGAKFATKLARISKCSVTFSEFPASSKGSYSTGQFYTVTPSGRIDRHGNKLNNR